MYLLNAFREIGRIQGIPDCTSAACCQVLSINFVFDHNSTRGRRKKCMQPKMRNFADEKTQQNVSRLYLMQILSLEIRRSQETLIPSLWVHSSERKEIIIVNP